MELRSAVSEKRLRGGAISREQSYLRTPLHAPWQLCFRKRTNRIWRDRVAPHDLPTSIINFAL